MRRQRGASLLFLLLLVALAGVVVAWFAWPMVVAARNERAEAAIARGVAPATSPSREEAEKRERAQAAEFAEVHGGLAGIVGSDHYRALNASCRALVDEYVATSDQATTSAAGAAAVRATVADIERRFGASCVDAPPDPPAPVRSPGPEPSPDTLGDRMRANPDYLALSPECRGYMDALAVMLAKPLNEPVTQAEKDRAAELSRNYEAKCVDREAEARARAEADAQRAADAKNFACNDRRERADLLRRAIAAGERYRPPPPGGIDVEGQQAHEMLDANKRQLEALDADIAANCR